MKPGDLITSSMKVEDHITHSPELRIILEEYHEPRTRDLHLPPFRIFKMLSSYGKVVEWSADNIERYWRVVE